MKENRKDFKKMCLLSIIIAMSLLTIMSSLYNISANAVYRYGYKEGDVYRFTMEMSSTSKTEEGTATTSTSYGGTLKIKDIEEDTGIYNIKITLISTSAYPGGSLIQDQEMEGDPIPFTQDLSSNQIRYGFGMPSMFITTDWEERGDEWKDYVDDLGDNKGWMIKDHTTSEGVFTVDIEVDVSDTDSRVDYDDDGDYDEYTGTVSATLKYDSNGVLSSFSTQTNAVFNKRNSITNSYKAYQGEAGLEWSEILPYMLMVIVGIIALVAGFAIGSRRAKGPKPATLPPAAPSAPSQTQRKKPSEG